MESLATQTLVIFAIRTRRIPFFRSRPSVPLLLAALAVVAVGAVLPASPFGAMLGFRPLPGLFFLALVLMVVAYLLLIEVPVGRVSFLADGEIVVLPVNHVMDGHDPVFRTAWGSKLSVAGGQDVVAFEADAYDERTRSGWSVLINGRAHAIYEEPEIQRLSRLGLRPWVNVANRPFWIRIRPTSISGRQTFGVPKDLG